MAKKVLIVDYSWSQTTAAMAAQLQQLTAATRIELTVAPGTFPSDMFATADVANQQLASGHLPELTNSWPELTQYAIILVGGPVWSAKVATPVRTFLKQLTTYSGTVAPFYTDAGTPGNYEADFASLLPTTTVVPGIGLTAGALQSATQPLTTWWQTLLNGLK
ncbi:flavodoxin [Lactobacillus sp. CBA3606]|uniref:flavodoxin n=1 Tax=Lactobacillus sp. CBA3606 TaxID=2099789 RepID=UPI000CFAC1BD|nr:flavodoxin [Lactobacillus sp. CBA3606]AVK64262.1 flavodoxin [Lactobacillus sp. CBA3606]